MFITFEGIDGSGKSTQIERTAQWLRDRGYDVVVSREPGGSDLGEAVRAVLLDPRWKDMCARTEYFLYSASRAQLVETVIRPHLQKSNAIVILDRYDDSSTAYQGGGRELGVDVIESINRFATGNLEPDVTFFLDADWETALTRRTATRRSDDRLEQNPREFFDRVRKIYHELAARHPKRFEIIDGSGGEAEVFAAITAILSERLSFKGRVSLE